MARYTVQQHARLRDIAYSAGISVDRLLKLNPQLLDENQNVKDDITGLELKLGKGNEIDRSKLRERLAPRRQEARNERLMQDTGFAAFMRQMGFDATEIENSFLATKEELKAQRMKQMPLFADQAMKEEERVNQSAEASGMFRSGQRLADVSDAVTQVDVRRQDFLDGLRETRRTAREEKNRGLAALERERAEQEIAAAERLTQRDAQTRFGV